MSDHRWGPRIMYFLLMSGSLLTIIQFSGFRMPHRWWWVAGISTVGAFVAEWAVHQGGRAGAGLLAGESIVERRPDPPLSRVKYLMEREEFDDALVELDLVWAAFPGRPEVVSCYERILVDRMAGPSGFAAFLEGALPKMDPRDRPYAFLRLAEIHADRIGNRAAGFHWASRLLAEFPGSDHAPAARALRESLKPRPS